METPTLVIFFYKTGRYFAKKGWISHKTHAKYYGLKHLLQKIGHGLTAQRRYI